MNNLKDGGGEDWAGHKNTTCWADLLNIPTELNIELNEGRELPIGSVKWTTLQKSSLKHTNLNEGMG